MWEWSKPKQNNCFASAAEKDSSLLSAYDDLLAEGTQPSAHPFRHGRPPASPAKLDGHEPPL